MSEVEITLNRQQLQTIDAEYEELVKKSNFDTSWETDYQAALMAPAAFLLDKVTNFETIYDRILFHLQEALRKTDDENIKKAIYRTTDDIFSKLICIIQNNIEFAKEKNKSILIDKLIKNLINLLETFNNPRTYISKLNAVKDISTDVARLLGDYLIYYNNKMKIIKDETIFYNQLAQVYQKILDSECFNPGLGLIQNTFARNKENIIEFVVKEKGLTAGKNLTMYDTKDSERQESARIITKALAKKANWEELIRYLHELRDSSILNYHDLESYSVTAYKEYVRGLILSGFSSALRKNLKKWESNLIEGAIQEFKSKINQNFNDDNNYFVRRKKTLNINRAVTVLLIPLMILLFILTPTLSESINVFWTRVLIVFLTLFSVVPLVFLQSRKITKINYVLERI